MQKPNFFYLLQRSYTCPKCHKLARQFVGVTMMKADPPLIEETAKPVPVKCNNCQQIAPAGISVIGEIHQIQEDKYAQLNLPHRIHIDN